MNEIQKFNLWLSENHSSFMIPETIVNQYAESMEDPFVLTDSQITELVLIGRSGIYMGPRAEMRISYDCIERIIKRYEEMRKGGKSHV